MGIGSRRAAGGGGFFAYPVVVENEFVAVGGEQVGGRLLDAQTDECRELNRHEKAQVAQALARVHESLDVHLAALKTEIARLQ